jgi:hypothetical protein
MGKPIIPEETICTRYMEGEWEVLKYTPPIDEGAIITHSSIKTDKGIGDLIILDVSSLGRCEIRYDIGVLSLHQRIFAMPQDIIAKYLAGEEAYRDKLVQDRQRFLDAEKAEIARRLKEKQRKRELEKIVRQELIDSGELFGDEPKRPPIPREVVDAVYKRDGGKCVYCGSVENLQLDHIIPFSKGGATSLENLQLLCQKCNIEKSNKIG